jgi:hypothetical protein
MLKGHSQEEMNEAERKYWMDAKARAKTRFIRREAIGTFRFG